MIRVTKLLSKLTMSVLFMVVIMSPAHINASISHIKTAKGNSSATFTAKPTLGNSVVVSCYSSTPLNASSVTDNQGNSYQLAAPISGTTSGSSSLGIYYAKVVNSAGTFKVSCNGYSSINIHEYSGIDSAQPLDTAGIVIDKYSKTTQTGVLTTLTSEAVLFAAIGNDNSATITPTNSFSTKTANTSPWRLTTADRIATTTGAYFASATFSKTTSNRIALAAFRPAGTGPQPTAPTTSITAPTSGSIITGNTTVTATAEPTDTSTITSVQFKIDGQNVGGVDTSAPYSVDWNSSSVANGSHSLTSTATTSNGLSTTSTVVVFSTSNITPPTVSISRPTNGATVFGTAAISAMTSDQIGVSSVQFLVDGVAFGQPDIEAPYETLWDTTAYSFGSHTISATAINTNGLTTTSSSSTVTVDNRPAAVAPNSSLTSPSDGTIVVGNTFLTATATSNDDATIVSVQFKLDGQNLGAPDTTEPYSYNWDSTQTPNGAHVITALALTSRGMSSPSNTATVTVDNPLVVSNVPASMKIISSSKPAFASSNGSNAGNLNIQFNASDNTAYDTYDSTSWTSAAVPTAAAPQWVAYDLSSVPAANKSVVDLIWYNNSVAYECCGGGTTNGVPKDYKIEVNSAPSTTSAPTAGWITLVNVSSNQQRIREHVLDLTGYNWVRLSTTSTTNAAAVRLMHLDVYDLSTSNNQAQDSWLFIGDSITAGATDYAEVYWHSPNNFTFASAINSVLPNYFPAQTDAGIIGSGTDDALLRIDSWLASFPGRYVDISYGTNDAQGSFTATQYYTNYSTLVQKVIAAGKTPVVSYVPWTSNTQYNAGASTTDASKGKIATFNQQLDNLFTAYPQIVKGPNFYQYFFNNQSLLGGGVHPNTQGYANMKRIWACQALKSVYRVPTAQLAANSMCAPYMTYLSN